VEVSPRKLGNALYEGEIEVFDNLWVLKNNTTGKKKGGRKKKKKKNKKKNKIQENTK
jgi:hypothetical protein